MRKRQGWPSPQQHGHHRTSRGHGAARPADRRAGWPEGGEITGTQRVTVRGAENSINDALVGFGQGGKPVLAYRDRPAMPN
jgi:hypothetical protein